MTTSSVASALKKLLPSKLPPSLSSRPGNLYQVLSRYPKDGVGQRVHQTRWGMKSIEGCYWEVTRSKLKLEGAHGKAWGHLVWRGMNLKIALTSFPVNECLLDCHSGKRVSAKEEQIPGGLKYSWVVGESRAPPKPKTLQ